MEQENGIADLNKLYDAFRASMKGSSWKPKSQQFESNWLCNLVGTSNNLEKRSYTAGEDESEFTINERGKTRHIHGSAIEDRVVRHVLCDNELQPKLAPYLIYNNGASRKGKGLAFSREMFERDMHNFYLKYRTNEGYVGFVDFSKFYDNIRHDKIREIIYPKIPEETHWLMDTILKHFEIDVSYMTDEEYENCIEQKFDSVAYYDNVPEELRKAGRQYMPKSVDIGDQVSQDVGVFFPTRIDNYVKIVRGFKWYGRYMDDMYIICKDREELKSIIAGIAVEAKELGLFINEKKTRICKLSDTFKYLQIKYTLTDAGKLIKRINPKNVTRERRRLKAYKHLIDEGKMTYADVEQAARSWMGEYSKLMSKLQIKHMKSLYQELFGKELTWKQQSPSKTERH